MAEVMEWTVLPWLEDEPIKRFLSGGVVVLVATTLYLYSQSLLLSAILMGVLLLALADYFFPVKYTLTEEGLKRISLYGERTVDAGAELFVDGGKVFFGRMRVFMPSDKREAILEALKRVGRPIGDETGRSGSDDRESSQMGGSSGV